MFRRYIASVIALFGLLALSGCVPSGQDGVPSPQPTKSADHSAGVGQTAENFNASTGLPETVYKVQAKSGDIGADGTPVFVTAIDLVLIPGTGVTDADAMLDWMMRAAWSINDNKPQHVIAQLIYVGYDNVDWDYAAALSDRGLDPGTVVEIYGDSLTFSFTAQELQMQLGEWPGAAPEFPSNALGTRNGKDLIAQSFDAKRPAGVKNINISTTQKAQELRFSYTTTVQVILDDGFVPADDTNALAWMIAVAWSVNDHKPESVILELTYSDGIAVPWNPDAVLQGWGLGRPTTGAALNFYGPDLELLVGPWPGNEPTVNLDGIFIRESDRFSRE